MERLTKLDRYNHYYTNEKVNDRMQLEEDYPHAYDGKAIDKLAHYEDLEEQGLLVKLPCKVDDTVYYVDEVACKNCEHNKDCYNGYKHECKYNVYKTKFQLRMLDYVGTSYFLTREEAENKLKEMESE